MRGRIWEIDAMRGLAIVLMIAFHLVYNLSEFYRFPIDYRSGFWLIIARAAVLLFMTTAGISSTFSRSNLRRGRSVLLYGLAVTLATWMFNPQAYIRFGILHFMGIGMMLYHFLRKIPVNMLIMLGAALLILGPIVTGSLVESPYLFPLGLVPAGFVSTDYYPLVPWYGFFLWGAAIGKQYYPEGKSLLSVTPNHRLLPFLGRHSLYIYLVHQPLLLVTLGLFFS
jgi:uncharacterized membrane protein